MRDFPGDPVIKTLLFQWVGLGGGGGAEIQHVACWGQKKKKKKKKLNIIFVTWWNTTTMRIDALQLQVTRWTRITNAILCKTIQKQDSTL